MTLFDVIRYPIRGERYWESFHKMPSSVKSAYHREYKRKGGGTIWSIKDQILYVERLLLEYEDPDESI